MSLSADELGEALGISRRAITRYVTAGCPHTRTGSGSRAPLRFELDLVKGWMRATLRTGDAWKPAAGLEVRDTPPALHDGRTARGLFPPSDEEDEEEDVGELVRKVNLQIKRLEVRKRERLESEADGELVPLADVKRAWAAQVEVVHARFRALPAKLAAEVEGKDYEETRAALERELRSVLVSFAVEELAI